MPNLKDIRIKISSVTTTRQVTSAMKMVSAAKFKKAHDNIVHIRPYVERLSEIILDLTSTLNDAASFEWSEEREVNKLLIVVVSSNRGLCAAFNTNVVKETERIINDQFKELYANNGIDVVTIGKQAEKQLKAHGYPVVKEYNDLHNSVTIDHVREISESIMNDFRNHKYDKVVLVYNEFVNTAVQNVRSEQFLPMQLPKIDADHSHAIDYIIEPDSFTFMEKVIPDALKVLFYRVILESLASEHGARMTSMHKATDNATEMIGDLKLIYNKARQGAITKEILEIVGGAEALKK